MPYLLFILWSLRTIVSLSEATYFWQLKEYRWDRMKEFLFEQGGMNHFFTLFHSAYLIILIVAYLFRYFSPTSSAFEIWFPIVIAVLFLAEVLRAFHRLFNHALKRPKLTGKALMILGLSFFLPISFLVFLFSSAEFPPEPSFAALMLGLLILIEHDLHAFSVMLMNAVSRKIKHRIFLKAQKKRLARKDLIVIGITGSFGKTSVKEYLAHLLAAKYRVLKTSKNTNTEIGIATTILEELSDSHQVFVCEMGAYSPGEIKLCCHIARPRIGIFTGLNNQHQALFKTLDRTFKTKWELISSLPDDGVSVFNGECEELRSRLPSSFSGIICDLSLVSDVQVQFDRVQFVYKKVLFEAPVLGAFQIINLLMALVTAEHLKIDLQTLADQMKTIKAPEKTMSLVRFQQGYLIDDSYNVNVDGLKGALSHLQYFPESVKVLFFPGILELGENSASIHEELGREIGHQVDYVFFFDPHFSESLIKGALLSGLTRSQIFEISDQEKIIQALQKLIEEKKTKKFVLLFESRGAEEVMKKLLP